MAGGTGGRTGTEALCLAVFGKGSHTPAQAHTLEGGPFPTAAPQRGCPQGLMWLPPACPWRPPNAAGSHSPAPDTPNPPHALKRASFTACWSYPNVIPSLNGKNTRDNQEIQRSIRKSRVWSRHFPVCPAHKAAEAKDSANRGREKQAKNLLIQFLCLGVSKVHLSCAWHSLPGQQLQPCRQEPHPWAEHERLPRQRLPKQFTAECRSTECLLSLN